MAVKVFIKRRFIEGKAEEVFSLLNKFRSEALIQTEYISGETLTCYDDPQKLLVISMWQSIDNWLKWKEHPSRKANEALLDQYLEGPTEYEVYGLGTTYSHKK